MSSSSTAQPAAPSVLPQIPTLTSPTDALQLALQCESSQPEQSVPRVLVPALRTLVRQGPQGEQALGTIGESGDVLAGLDMARSSAAWLFILTSRLHVFLTTPPPSSSAAGPSASPSTSDAQGSAAVDPFRSQAAYFLDLARRFVDVSDITQLRYAPERVTRLAKAIWQLSLIVENPKASLYPLRQLLIRYTGNSIHWLTTIHPIFLHACITTRMYAYALPIIRQGISEVSTSLSDLTYQDNLLYHHHAGYIYAALRKWDEAAEAFEGAVSAPGTGVSAIQMDAFKRLVLVQIIGKGRASPPPKYTSAQLQRTFKALAPAYHALLTSTSPCSTTTSNATSAFPDDPASSSPGSKKAASAPLTRADVEKHRAEFENDGNWGLAQILLDQMPGREVARLEETFGSVGLAEVGRVAGLGQGAQAAERRAAEVVLGLIQSSTIHARLSLDPPMLTFTPPPDSYADAPAAREIERLLARTNETGRQLASKDGEEGRGRAYLKKANQNAGAAGMWSAGSGGGGFGAGGAEDVEMLGFGSVGAGGGGGSDWADEFGA